MFYIKQYWLVLIKNPIEGFIFALVSIILILSSVYSADISNKISKELKVSESSYFYSLIPKRENIPRIARKLRAIPFVSKVEIMKKSLIEKQVKKTLKSLDFDLTSHEVNLDYAGIKIIYKVGLEKRSQELIRNYLKRFVGEKKIIMGDIVTPKVPIWKRSALLKNFLEYGAQLTTLFIFLLWIPVSLLFKRKLETYTLLLEFYQRRSHLNLKISSVGMGGLFCITLFLSFASGASINEMSVGIFLVFFAMMAFQFKPVDQ